MKLQKWSPDFDPSKDPPVVPIWFKFPRLPYRFFNQKALFQISRALGTPLQLDSHTYNKARPATARVLIERDVTLPEISKIWIGSELEGAWQEVVMEQRPYYCQHCKMFGHTRERCFRLLPPKRFPKKPIGSSADGLNLNILPAVNQDSVLQLAEVEEECIEPPRPTSEYRSQDDCIIQVGNQQHKEGLKIGTCSQSREEEGTPTQLGSLIGEDLLKQMNQEAVTEWKVQQSKKKKKGIMELRNLKELPDEGEKVVNSLLDSLSRTRRRGKANND